MKPTVSFLIGSGFSIPEGLPAVGQLNERLSKIYESEILVHTSQRAMFLDGQEDVNRGSGWDERLFVQEFLEFYNEEVLKPGSHFHYETFYDFYSGYLYDDENDESKELIEKFYKGFNERNFKGHENYRKCYDRINDFNRTFNQLLASRLHRTQYFQDISQLNYPEYDSFINLLRDLLKTCNVKFHSLNHDLFFDWLGRNHSELWQHFTDGYELEGSPYYGRLSFDFNPGTPNQVHKTYYVKLERFVNRFDKPLCFFKLHGSIFTTIVQSGYPENMITRIKGNYGIDQYYVEVKDKKSGDFRLQHLWDEAAPDFLSGTTNKTRYYTGDPFYKTLFKHFEKNLSNSELLVVVGYGFQDNGINEYLEKEFLSKNKLMIVIDPVKPLTKLIDKYNVKFIPKGVIELTYDEYISHIPTSLIDK